MKSSVGLILLSICFLLATPAQAELTHERAESLLSQLEEIAKKDVRPLEQYFETQETLNNWTTSNSPVMTFYSREGGFLRNFGEDITEVEEFVDILSPDSLKHLPPGVLVPVLSLISLDQLENLREGAWGQHDPWAKSVRIATLIKTWLIVDNEFPRKDRQGEKYTRIQIGAALLGLSAASALRKWPQQFVNLFPDPRVAGLVGVGSFFGLLGTIAYAETMKVWGVSNRESKIQRRAKEDFEQVLGELSLVENSISLESCAQLLEEAGTL